MSHVLSSSVNEHLLSCDDVRNSGLSVSNKLDSVNGCDDNGAEDKLSDFSTTSDGDEASFESFKHSTDELDCGSEP